MDQVQSHDQEVQELYEKITAVIPGTDRFRAISLEGFTAAIDQMMNKAYYHGTQHSFQTVEAVMSRIFKK